MTFIQYGKLVQNPELANKFFFKIETFPPQRLRMAINYVRPWFFRKQKAFENSKECRIVKSQFFSARFCQPTNVSAIEKVLRNIFATDGPKYNKRVNFCFSEYLKYGLVWILDNWSASGLRRIHISDIVWNWDRNQLFRAL